MSTPKETINQYLKTMGFGSQLAEVAGLDNYLQASVNHMGLMIAVNLDQQIYVVVSGGVGFLPKANLAPLFRRLLVLNGLMIPKLTLVDQFNQISMTLVRGIEALDYVEFKWMVDTWGSAYWQFITPLIQEFQIPAQP